jgi:PadR family transcriptional regulator, regulatory protein PadR
MCPPWPDHLRNAPLQVLGLTAIAEYAIVPTEVDENMQIWMSQVKKGVIELWLLAMLARGETYGYELLQELSVKAGTEVSESAVYPLLARLTREGWVTVRVCPSPAGPARRYYRLTPLGVARLEQMKDYWAKLQKASDTILSGGQD